MSYICSPLDLHNVVKRNLVLLMSRQVDLSGCGTCSLKIMLRSMQTKGGGGGVYIMQPTDLFCYPHGFITLLSSGGVFAPCSLIAGIKVYIAYGIY